jgi:hypothetical protein
MCKLWTLSQPPGIAFAMAGTAAVIFSTIWDGFCDILPTLMALSKGFGNV